MANDSVRVLVIQNHPEDLAMIRRACDAETHMSLVMECVGTLKDGLMHLERGDFSFIILDLFLPDSKGMTTFDQVVAKAPQIPTVVLSDLDDEAVAFEVIKKGAQDYLVRGRVYDKVILRVMRYAIERKRVEDKLRQTQELYRTLASNLPGTIVLLFDKNLRFTLAEGMGLSGLGFSKEILEGKTLAEVTPPSLCEELEPHYRSALAGKKSTFEINYRDRTYLYQTLPLPNGKSDTDAGLAMAVDITERKLLEQTKDDFMNNVSHELRTPLAMIKEGVSQVIDGTLGDLTDDQRQFLNITYENTNRLARIINELLDLSKIESGRIEIKKEWVDLVSIAKSVNAMFKLQVQKQGLELKFQSSQPKIELYADKDRITQVIMNLIGNALKFTDKGYIEVSLRETPGVVECCVRDTGKGIAESNLPKVFGKFHQFEREAGPGAKGTGLGLAISQGIIEMHEGKIWVESQITEGTQFKFTLPKYSARALYASYLKSLVRAASEQNECFSVVFVNIVDYDGGVKGMGKNKMDQLVMGLEGVIKKSLRKVGDKTVVKDNRAILVILPETSKNQGLMAAGRLEQSLENHLMSLQADIKPKVSCRVTGYPEDAKTEADFLKKALW